MRSTDFWLLDRWMLLLAAVAGLGNFNSSALQLAVVIGASSGIGYEACHVVTSGTSICAMSVSRGKSARRE
jgi:hypothetical protein